MYVSVRRNLNVADDEVSSAKFVQGDAVEDIRPRQATLMHFSVVLWALSTRISVVVKVQTPFLVLMHTVRPWVLSGLKTWIMLLFEESEVMDDQQLQLFLARILFTTKNS